MRKRIDPVGSIHSSQFHARFSPQMAAAAVAKSIQSCPTLRAHRRQPSRLPCPWDSPGKNTGVGCYFLLQCMKKKSESEVAQSCPTLHNPVDWSLPGSSIHGIFQARVLEGVAIAFSNLKMIKCHLWKSCLPHFDFQVETITIILNTHHLPI